MSSSTENRERLAREKQAQQLRSRIADFELLAEHAVICTAGVKTPLWQFLKGIGTKAERHFQAEVYDMAPPDFERRQAEVRGIRSLLAEVEYHVGKEQHYRQEADQLRKILEAAENAGRVERKD